MTRSWEGRYALSTLLTAHGVAHLIGFAVPWRLMNAADMPFKTTLLAGRVDVGEAGIRVIGVLWLITAIVMIATALGLAVRARWAGWTMLPILIVSLALCLVELPQARFGLLLNGALVLFIVLHPELGVGTMRREDARDIASARLDASTHDSIGAFTFSSVEDLPLPVARYFRHVLSEGQPLVTWTTFMQEGQFSIGDDEDGWSAASALQRYLAEAVWFPTALLPVSGVSWTALDERCALASVTEDGTTVSLVFQFNDQDEVEFVAAPARLREVQGRSIPTPWVVTCHGYVWHDGMRIPTYGEASWILESGLFPDWSYLFRPLT